MVVLLALVAGFGGGWIAHDLTTRDRPASTRGALPEAPAGGEASQRGGGEGTAGPVRAGVRTEPDCMVFPPDNPWNTDISALPRHPRSDAWVASVGLDGDLHPDFGTIYEGEPIGIPYAIVPAGQPRVPISFEYADESDPGPYPIPPDASIEGGDDRHIIVIEEGACLLFEVYAAETFDEGRSWQAGSGAVFDLRSNRLRPDTWTSADAAGLPIFAGLVRYDEVAGGEIDHALRFTIRETQRAFIHPATHWASSRTDPDLPPMGARFRMKAGYDCSPYAPEVQVICAALKRYGMFVADNGSNWFISGAPDERWDDEALADLKDIPGSAFEVVDTGEDVVVGS